MTNRNLYHMRKEYSQSSLEREHLCDNPFEQFSRWFEEALEFEPHEANAMTLATVDSNSAPSARVVLLKSFSADGFIFFTNYSSKKGGDISVNNRVALLFYWPQTMRQVRVEGSAFKIDPSESDEYFNSRPALSKASSALSKQSSPLENRDEFDKRVNTLLGSGAEISRPDNWGGYSVKPDHIEFWQGGVGRSHDRFIYSLEGSQEWSITRLYP
ncbi:MAG: pyridoxamine 5'-phosphate oxidase [Bacteroidetes bacterium RIFOXYA12_FULL_40_10]|nr:MAG: pyridoxamine 5'-phosphate oxidase [Bacteroidetes bacterium GWE2_40_15]OFY91393.1 MAG: pyridoxamine 5'-phosphate oxidase [Bacteroidetes bacterium RIFOXYA12_FULL_40_10]HBZ25424.1 pyridoxamine 5'-phosphate oxidase [Rikenellaceae bacterium]